jgi:hypothetical protein
MAAERGFLALTGEAVYASIGLGARRLAHRRAATILDRAGAVDRVAVHLLAAGPVGARGWWTGFPTLQLRHD